MMVILRRSDGWEKVVDDAVAGKPYELVTPLSIITFEDNHHGGDYRGDDFYFIYEQVRERMNPRR
jgi:hypothetical protein